MTHPQSSPRLLNQIALPGGGRRASDPLHSIALDASGGIFYSDPFNHAVGSLDAGGKLRWHHGGKGDRQGQFWYPLGISLGWFGLGEGMPQECVAIGDSWNRRVQFLGVNGEELGSWVQAGSVLFDEVTDVRFVPALDGCAGYWLVVDKGNHRVCAMDLFGNLLFEIGKGARDPDSRFAPALLSDVDPEQPGIVAEFPAFETLYYPTRLLGRSAACMYVWEPLARSLKRWIHGNLLTVRFRPCAPDEWIAADGEGLLGWSQSAGRVWRYDASGTLQSEAQVSGTFVLSDTSSHEMWFQSGENLLHWAWDKMESNASPQPAIQGIPILLRSAEEDISGWDDTPVEKVVAAILEYARGLITLTSRVVVGLQSLPPGEPQFAELRSLLKTWRECAPLACEDFARVLYPWSQTLLKLNFSRAADAQHILLREAEPPVAPRKFYTAQFRSALREIQQQWDDLFMALSTRRVRADDPPGPSRELALLAADVEWELQVAVHWFFVWSYGLEWPIRIQRLLEPDHHRPDAEPATPGFPLRRPASEGYRSASSTLREVTRISLAGAAPISPLQPAYLAQSPGGDLFVSLFGANLIVHLNREGKLLQTIGRSGSAPGELDGPSGIAFDREGRLWVAEIMGHRIQIWNEQGNPLPPIPDSGMDGFSLPIGLYAQPDGSVLSADAGLHRVMRLYADGDGRILCQERGGANGQFRQPHSFAIDPLDTDDSFWVIDKRNHRVQKVDSQGRFIRTVGSYGWGKQCLLLPVSVAVLPGQRLVVAQDRLCPILKTFDAAGKEIEQMLLDYRPGGMLVFEKRLWVTQYDGDSLVVYDY